MTKRKTPYGRGECAYCCDRDPETGEQKAVLFDKEHPNQRHCSIICHQYHEIELNGGQVMPMSKNFKRLSDYPEFRALSISKAESDEEKLIKKVRRFNTAEARRNTHFDKPVNTSVLYGFDGKVFRLYESTQEKNHQITLCSFRKKFIYETILELIS